MSKPDRERMLDRAHSKLSMRRQCVLLSLARSGVYRSKPPANDDDVLLMRRLDELFTAWPFLGSRRMTAMLRADGHRINRKPLGSGTGAVVECHLYQRALIRTDGPSRADRGT